MRRRASAQLPARQWSVVSWTPFAAELLERSARLANQYVGHVQRADDVLIEGDPDSCDFAATFVCDASPVAALAVGRPRAIAQARKRIEQTYSSQARQTEARAA